jgi:HEAT repeat protein
MGLHKHTEHEPLREVARREFARDADGLVAQLRATDANQRRWAARDLAQYPDHAAALGERLVSEPDASVREALLVSLATHANDAAVAALLPLLRSEDAALRNGAIEVLAGMPAVVQPRISALLQDADPDVRIFTINVMGEMRDARVPGWLMQVLRHDTAINVVAAAVEVLAEAGSAEHVEALRTARERFGDDAYIAFIVDLAIERIQSS